MPTLPIVVETASCAGASLSVSGDEGRPLSTTFFPQSEPSADPSLLGTAPPLAADAMALRAKHALKAKLFPEHTALAQQIGRFTILRELGRGGMGVVYVAYDETLDRRVAIKLLYELPGVDPADQTRLLREAQAMARLNHPNIAAVYEAGTHDGRVFIAMEFVQGTALDVWLHESPRPWRKVVEVFIQAGHGLAAAHQVGLVHRDFKPANVMLGDDGRVRVLDFGLAHRSRVNDPHDDLAPTLNACGEPPFDADTIQVLPNLDPLSLEGMIVGTPAYMPPEQFRGQPTDARADQYAFCVSLFEGLYGQLPFAGHTLDTLWSEVLRGVPRASPRGASVPAPLHRTIVRGLSADPAQRYRSMVELLARLENRPRRWLRGWLAAALCVGALVGGISSAEHYRKASCDLGEKVLAGVWDSSSKAEVRAIFDRSTSPLAAEAWVAAEHDMDAHANRLTEALRQGCENHQRGEDSDLLYERRRSCLHREALALDMSVGALRHLDPIHKGTVDEALRPLATLPDCSNSEALRHSRDPIPLQDQPAVDGVLRKLNSIDQQRYNIQAKMFGDQGAFRRLLVESNKLVEEARRLDYKGFLAETLYYRSSLEKLAGQKSDGCDSLLESYALADLGENDALAARIAQSIPSLCEGDTSHSNLVFALQLARAKLARAGLIETVSYVEMLTQFSHYFTEQNKSEEADLLLLEALAIVERTPRSFQTAAPGFDVAIKLFTILSMTGSPEERPRLRAAITTVLGDGENTYGTMQMVAAMTEARVGNWAAAEAITRATAAALLQGDPSDRNMAIAMMEISASLQLTQDKCTEALATLDSINREFEILRGTGSTLQGSLHLSAIHAHALCGDPNKARKMLGNMEQTLKSIGPAGDIILGQLTALTKTSPDNSTIDSIQRSIDACQSSPLCASDLSLLPSLLETQAQVYFAMGEHTLAISSARRSVDISTELWGQNNIVTATSLMVLGQAELALGNAEEAVLQLEKALNLRRGSDPQFRGDSEYALARALLQISGDTDRPRKLAAAALADYQLAGSVRQPERARVEAWLIALDSSRPESPR